MLGLVFGERIEEYIDRRPFPVHGCGAAKTEPTLANGEDRARRQNIDMLRLNPLAVPGFDNWHLGGAAEDLGQHALAVRRQMGDDHKGEPIASGDGPEELFECLDPAR
jgi:hypothetical protein